MKTDLTTLTRLDHLNAMMQDDLCLTLDDFFHISVNNSEIRLQWASRKQTLAFSELIQSLDNLSKFAYIEDYSNKWEAEHHWFSVSFRIQYDTLNWYEVNIVVH